MAHRRCARTRRAVLRSQQGGVTGFRFVLGIRVGSDPRRKLPEKPERQPVRAAARLREGAERAEPAAERRPAVFRSRRNRRGDTSHDRDAEGLGRPRVVVDHARAEARVICQASASPPGLTTQVGVYPTCALKRSNSDKPSSGGPSLFAKMMDCRVISAFTRVFNALCPAMTKTRIWLMPTRVCAAPPTAADAWARLRGSWSSSTTHSARRAAPRG